MQAGWERQSSTLISSSVVPLLSNRLVHLERRRRKRHQSIHHLRSTPSSTISANQVGGEDRTDSLGAKTLTPLTCVSLPFRWFEMIAIWIKCALIGSLSTQTLLHQLENKTPPIAHPTWTHSTSPSSSPPAAVPPPPSVMCCHPFGDIISTYLTSCRSP